MASDSAEIQDLREVGQEALNILQELNLSNLPGRPFDNAFKIFAPQAKPPSLIVMGLNGSLDDSIHTNQTAIEDGIEKPEYSNIQNGIKYGWGPKKVVSEKSRDNTLPVRLKYITEKLGFCIDKTVFTNTILICSENSDTIRNRAELFGNLSLRTLIEKSMAFHKHFTFKRSQPKAIIIHGNSFYSFSAANALRQSFQTSEVHFIEMKGRFSSYFFETTIEGQPTPTLAIPHMSRIPPDDEVLTQFSKVLGKTF